MCNYIHREVVVIGNSEVSQFTEVHVSSSSDSIHDEDVRGESQGATCRLQVEKIVKQNITNPTSTGDEKNVKAMKR